MRYSKIDEFEIVNGEGVGVSIYTQGCPFHCEGCFNQELWNMETGNLWTSKEEDEVMGLLNRKGIDRLTIVGGEPLLDRNIKELTHLFERIRGVYGNDIKIWVYTGNDYDYIKEHYKNILTYIDVLIDGRFILAQRDITLKFRGSSNQRVIDVPQSLMKGEVILYG